VKFTGQELSDIRDAVFSKVETLGEHLEALDGVVERLERRERVFPFAVGVEGVRAAKGMRSDMEARRDRLQALAERLVDL